MRYPCAQTVIPEYVLTYIFMLDVPILQSLALRDYGGDWAAVVIAVVIALAAIGAMFAGSRLLSARRRSAVKLTTYECGIPPTPFAWSNINIRFYIFAILFLIFDVEAVFLFPWAVVFIQEKAAGNPIPFYAMLLFLAMLFFAVIYGWRKGVLDWQK